MNPKTAAILSALLTTGAAIGAEVPGILDAVGKLTDDKKRNDARAALSLHAISGRIADRVLDTVPGAPGDAIELMHDGLHLILRGAIMAATGEDPIKDRSRKPSAPASETAVGLPPWLVV